jgi:imidazolonepropionase
MQDTRQRMPMQEPSSTALLFTGAASVASCVGPARELEDSDPAGEAGGVAVAVDDGSIRAVDRDAELQRRYPHAERIDCSGGLLTPGLIDSHTHAVFGRWRADEYVLRSRGVPYMEIARRGGGIHASVRDLRARSEEELVDLALPRLAEMLAQGTTTAEVKSGYGLSTRDELKMLRAVRRLRDLQPIDLVPTFLGAHEVPEEYQSQRAKYVSVLVEEMIPAVAESRLADYCDVFMEPGVFGPSEAERILRAGMEHGLRPRIHADELEWSGGAELAAALGAASADHLGSISDAGVRAIAESPTVATLLPATLFFLGRPAFAPARALLDAGATVALATDFNPGSSPTTSLHFAMTAACSRMSMSPAEALRAATAGGAAALELNDGRGTLRPGAPADLALWRVSSVAELPYRMAVPLLTGLWKRGVRVR